MMMLLQPVENEKSSLLTVISDIRLRVFAAAGLAICIAIFVPYGLFYIRRTGENKALEKCLLDHELRIDCLPGIPLPEQKQSECERVSCCWDLSQKPIPPCFHPYPTKYSYQVAKVREDQHNRYEIELIPNFENTSLSTTPSNFTKVNVKFLTSNHLHILMYTQMGFDSTNYITYNTKQESDGIDPNYNVSFPNSGRFHIRVHRRENFKKIEDFRRKPIFNTVFGPTIISSGFTEVTTLLPSHVIYGIGQSPKSSFRHDLQYPRKYVLFSRSEYNSYFHFSPSKHFVAGVHPFYMGLESDGKAHGVFLLNSFPTEIVTTGAPSVTFRTTGSRLEFHLFLGPTPADVISQLMEFVGRPAMPPYWALGYHSCREASDLGNAFSFLKFTQIKRIPHESDCGSSTHFLPHAISNNTSNISDLVHELKISNRRLIAFHIPQVVVDQDPILQLPPLTPNISELIANTLLVRHPNDETPFIGNLANGTEVAYMDLFSSNINSFLAEYYRRLDVERNADGIFLDLNTPVNFDFSFANETYCKKDSHVHSWPALPLWSNATEGTICPNARHVGDIPHNYLHNLYGYKHMLVTREVLKRQNKFSLKRPFISSLSTFTGSGAHGGYWGGQVEASWKSLKESLVQTLDFSLFGIPLNGAPACGTSELVDSDLCARWLQLAAFQPLLLTHRLDESEMFFKNRRLTHVARSMIQLRYSLLPYLYGLFYNATKRGHIVIRPLLIEFPKTRETYDIDEQFMWGSALLVSPILKPSIEVNSVFFPPGCWFDYYTGKKESQSLTGTFKQIASIHNHVNLHVRGGYIIPSQIPKLTTSASRRQNWTLTVALSCLQHASKSATDSNSVSAFGEIFIDDGETNLEEGNYLLVSVIARGRNISISPNINNGTEYVPNVFVSTILNKIHIYGVREEPSKFYVDAVEKGAHYNSAYESVTIDDLNIDLRGNHEVAWQPLL